MKRSMLSALVVLGLATSACSFHARDPEAYRKVTRDLVATKNDAIRQCYAAELERSPEAGGKVVVSFRVEEKTGKILEPKLDDQASTAPPSLGKCVTQAIDGLALDPPDAREGIATFTWDFQHRG